MNAEEETKGSRNDKDLSAKNHGQELVESDVLDLCRVDVASLLITRLSRMEKMVTVTWKIVSSFQWGLILPSCTASLFTRRLIQQHLVFKCSQRSDLLCSRKKMVCIIVRIWGEGQVHISITVPVMMTSYVT